MVLQKGRNGSTCGFVECDCIAIFFSHAIDCMTVILIVANVSYDITFPMVLWICISWGIQ